MTLHKNPPHPLVSWTERFRFQASPSVNDDKSCSNTNWLYQFFTPVFS